MTPNSSIIKITAKTALKGKLFKSVFASVVVMIAFFITNYSISLLSLIANEIFIGVLSAIATVFIISPIIIGLLRYFWHNIFDVNDNPIAVFYYFSSKSLYFNVIKLIFTLIFKSLPIGILLFLPTVFLWIISHNYIFDLINIAKPLWSANLSYIILFSRTFATVILIIYMLKFYIAPVLFVADENMDISEAMLMSSVISKKTTLDFIYLFFSFFGWVIISIFVIPMLYTIPYILTAYLVHARFAIADYNKHLNEKFNVEFPSYETGV